MAPNPQSSDVESIAAQLRAGIRKARVPRSDTMVHLPKEPAADLLQSAMNVAAAVELEAHTDHDLQILRSTYDVAGAPFTSHRRLLGPFIIAIKNFARELLVQLFARQSAYNGAAARSITHLNHRLNLLAQEHARVAQRLAELESRLDAAQPSLALRQPRMASGAVQADRFALDGAEHRVDSAQEAIDESRRHPRGRS